MLNVALIKQLNTHGDLTQLTPQLVEISDIYLDSVWYSGQTKVIPASAHVLVLVGAMTIHCHCDVNLTIDEHGVRDVAVFCQKPTVTSQNIWFNVFTTDSNGVLNDEDADSIETTWKLLKILPNIHPDKHLDALKKSGLKQLDKISSLLDEAFKNETPEGLEPLGA